MHWLLIESGTLYMKENILYMSDGLSQMHVDFDSYKWLYRHISYLDSCLTAIAVLQMTWAEHSGNFLLDELYSKRQFSKDKQMIYVAVWHFVSNSCKLFDYRRRKWQLSRRWVGFIFILGTLRHIWFTINPTKLTRIETYRWWSTNGARWNRLCRLSSFKNCCSSLTSSPEHLMRSKEVYSTTFC